MNKDTNEKGGCEKSVAQTALFAAANSGKGFKSFYGDVFGSPEIKRRYLIKGGPGTGKSTFMRRLGKSAEERGIKAEYYLCSSDPDSLDGLILGGKVALMDATAPHTADADIAGARDEIVDLGSFWDAESLEEEYGRIAYLSSKKSECYRGAYRFLEGALAVDIRSRELILPFVDRDKLRGAVERAASKIPMGSGYSLATGIRSSIGMKGRISLDTYEKEAKTLYCIKDSFGMGALFLEELMNEAIKRRCRVRISYRPIDSTQPDALLFEESGICFVVGESDLCREARNINMERFICFSRCAEGEARRVKSEYRSNTRIYNALIGSASERLLEAGRYHFELEEIYKARMDFKSQSEFTQSFCDKVFKYLEK